jgi:hypothetical protein
MFSIRLPITFDSVPSDRGVGCRAFGHTPVRRVDLCNGASRLRDSDSKSSESVSYVHEVVARMVGCMEQHRLCLNHIAVRGGPRVVPWRGVPRGDGGQCVTLPLKVFKYLCWIKVDVNLNVNRTKNIDYGKLCVGLVEQDLDFVAQ